MYFSQGLGHRMSCKLGDYYVSWCCLKLSFLFGFGSKPLYLSMLFLNRQYRFQSCFTASKKSTENLNRVNKTIRVV